LFYISNEGLSIIENVGLMGVPLPSFLKRMFEQLKADNNNPINGLPGKDILDNIEEEE
jgi:phage-related holin